MLECIQALKELKEYMSSPPLFSMPEPGERLLAYLTILEVVVSAFLVQEDKGTEFTIYYISKTLMDAETRYLHLEKLAMSLVIAS